MVGQGLFLAAGIAMQLADPELKYLMIFNTLYGGTGGISSGGDSYATSRPRAKISHDFQHFTMVGQGLFLAAGIAMQLADPELKYLMSHHRVCLVEVTGLEPVSEKARQTPTTSVVLVLI